MSFRSFCHFMIWLIILSVFTLTVISYIVDPIGVWGTSNRIGINNYKIHQGNYLDVFKPYEVVRTKPKVIWIGSSRVYVGFQMDENEREYNMGASSLNLPDIKEYLRFIYHIQTPRKVYLGLDLFQFSNKSYRLVRNGYSSFRLNKVSEKGMGALLMKSKDAFGTIKEVPMTVWQSIRHCDSQPIFECGWDRRRGNAKNINQQEFYAYVTSFRKDYDDFLYTENAMDCLKDILAEADENNVEIVLFFNPVTVDLQALQHITEHDKDFYHVKQEVAAIHPVYDFCWVNQYTVDRQGWFYDASHYRAVYGDICRAAMNGKDNGSARLLTANNVNQELEQEDILFDNWKKNNIAYYDVLKEKSKGKIPVGSLKEYIGF